MTLLERAGSRRRVTWISLLGALLLPALIGGILIATLHNPTAQLDKMTAAVVNDDKAVTIDGELLPLGRELTAKLVKGSSSLPSNVQWTITNKKDADAGLSGGRYTAVVTVPENFSAAATSTARDVAPEKATISVRTAADSRVLDGAISAQLTQAAASLTGRTLSETYLQNVFLGFTTLGKELGSAASGAQQLADGAKQLSDGAREAAAGATQLPEGASALGQGADQLSTGAGQLATGLGQLTGGIGQASDGAGVLATELQKAASAVDNRELVQAADTARANAEAAGQQTATVAGTLGGLAETCASGPNDPRLCEELAVAAEAAVTAATSAGTAAAYAEPTASGIATLTSQTAAGLTDAAAQTRVLQSGLTELATGAAQSVDGAQALAAGAGQLRSGAGELTAGAQSLADGVKQLSSGSASVETGTRDLASGLGAAVANVPSYTDEQAKNRAAVVADPVVATGSTTKLFGASAVPLLVTAALWFGGLGTFVVLRATPSRELSSRRPSTLLALRSLWPAAAIGAVQGMLIAGVVQVAASYEWADWWAFAAVSVAAGIAFAVVNQAFVAVLGGAGRWLSALVGVLAIATGVVSVVPPAVSAVAGMLPTAPAHAAMLGTLTPAGGAGAALAGLAIWSILAFLVTTFAVSRGRRISVRQLLAASPA